MKFLLSPKALALAAAALSLISTARAHSVWLEPLDGKMVVRFGEPHSEHETSPGHLDEISVPLAFTIITNGAVAVDATKTKDHYKLGAGLAPTNTLCVETSFIVMTTPGRPGRKPNFYARWQPQGAGAAVPLLNLDIVPTGKKGEARVYFRGQPLPDVKAVLMTPDELEQEIVADREGYLRFTTTKPGPHHLSIGRHRETLAGFHLGNAYDLTSHNAALTWIEP